MPTFVFIFLYIYIYIICQLKDLILTLFGLIFKRIYIYICVCKIQIAVQPLIDIQSLNPGQIATSQTSVPLIYVLFFKFSNRRPILKPMVISHFSNRHPMTSLMYALTNKSDIDLRILKDSDLRIPLNRTVI